MRSHLLAAALLCFALAALALWVLVKTP